MRQSDAVVAGLSVSHRAPQMAHAESAISDRMGFQVEISSTLPTSQACPEAATENPSLCHASVNRVISLNGNPLRHAFERTCSEQVQAVAATGICTSTLRRVSMTSRQLDNPV
jgi:hypothetical protein